MLRTPLSILIVAGLLPLVGCETPPDANGGGPSTTIAEVDYADLSRRYNRRVGRIESIHARAVIELDYVDANGKGHFEQGDGLFAFRRPLDLAISIGKLGEIFLWIGSDSERYWWLELKPGNGEPKTAYIGRHTERVAIDDGAGPLPVGPDELLGLIGLAPIPSHEESHPEAVSLDGGKRAAVTTPLGSVKGRGPERVTLIDVATARPIEATLYNAAGEVIVESKLGQYEPMKIEGAPPGAWPWVPTRIELSAPSRKARLTLFLNNPSDGKTGNKIKDAQFDFEKLTDLLEVERTRVIRPRDRVIPQPDEQPPDDPGGS